jgi:hypothetical protein
MNWSVFKQYPLAVQFVAVQSLRNSINCVPSEAIYFQRRSYPYTKVTFTNGAQGHVTYSDVHKMLSELKVTSNLKTRMALINH